MVHDAWRNLPDCLGLRKNTCALKAMQEYLKSLYRPVSTEIQQALAPIHYLWVGTDHAVCFVESLEQFPVHQWGERIRHDPAFGEQGTNVMFVAVEGPDTLALRSYESLLRCREAWSG